MKKLLVVLMALATAIAVSGCAPKIHPTKPFDAEAARAALAPGNNTIKGSSLVRTKVGFSETCAGFDVALIPVTEASSEIMEQAFGSTQRGSYGAEGRIYEMDMFPGAQVLSVNRKDQCDPQGFFEFKNVADGDFYLLTHIRWLTIPTSLLDYNQSAYIMNRVHVSGGQTVNVDLMPEVSKGFIF